MLGVTLREMATLSIRVARLVLGCPAVVDVLPLRCQIVTIGCQRALVSHVPYLDCLWCLVILFHEGLIHD